MNINFDLFGQEINVHDHVVCSCSHKETNLYLYRVTGFTKSGQLQVQGFLRTRISSPHTSCVKISNRELVDKMYTNRSEHQHGENLKYGVKPKQPIVEFDDWLLNQLNAE